MRHLQGLIVVTLTVFVFTEAASSSTSESANAPIPVSILSPSVATETTHNTRSKVKSTSLSSADKITELSDASETLEFGTNKSTAPTLKALKTTLNHIRQSKQENKIATRLKRTVVTIKANYTGLKNSTDLSDTKLEANATNTNSTTINDHNLNSTNVPVTSSSSSSSSSASSTSSPLSALPTIPFPSPSKNMKTTTKTSIAISTTNKSTSTSIEKPSSAEDQMKNGTSSALLPSSTTISPSITTIKKTKNDDTEKSTNATGPHNDALNSTVAGNNTTATTTHVGISMSPEKSVPNSTAIGSSLPNIPFNASSSNPTILSTSLMSTTESSINSNHTTVKPTEKPSETISNISFSISIPPFSNPPSEHTSTTTNTPETTTMSTSKSSSVWKWFKSLWPKNKKETPSTTPLIETSTSPMVPMKNVTIAVTTSSPLSMMSNASSTNSSTNAADPLKKLNSPTNPSTNSANSSTNSTGSSNSLNLNIASAANGSSTSSLSILVNGSTVKIPLNLLLQANSDIDNHLDITMTTIASKNSRDSIPASSSIFASLEQPENTLGIPFLTPRGSYTSEIQIKDAKSETKSPIATTEHLPPSKNVPIPEVSHNLTSRSTPSTKSMVINVTHHGNSTENGNPGNITSTIILERTENQMSTIKPENNINHTNAAVSGSRTAKAAFTPSNSWINEIASVDTIKNDPTTEFPNLTHEMVNGILSMPLTTMLLSPNSTTKMINSTMMNENITQSTTMATTTLPSRSSNAIFVNGRWELVPNATEFNVTRSTQKYLPNAVNVTHMTSTNVPTVTQKNLTNEQKATQNFLINELNLTQKNLTSTANVNPKNLTTAPSLTHNNVTTVPNVNLKNLTTVPNVSQNNLTTVPIVNQNNLTTVPNATQKNLTTAPSLIHDNLTTAANVSLKNLTTAPSLIHNNLTTAPNVSLKNLTAATNVTQKNLTTATNVNLQNWPTASNMNPKNLTTVPSVTQNNLTAATSVTQKNLTTATNVNPQNLTTAPPMTWNNLTTVQNVNSKNLTTTPIAAQKNSTNVENTTQKNLTNVTISTQKNWTHLPNVTSTVMTNATNASNTSQIKATNTSQIISTNVPITVTYSPKAKNTNQNNSIEASNITLTIHTNSSNGTPKNVTTVPNTTLKNSTNPIQSSSTVSWINDNVPKISKTTTSLPANNNVTNVTVPSSTYPKSTKPSVIPAIIETVFSTTKKISNSSSISLLPKSTSAIPSITILSHSNRSSVITIANHSTMAAVNIPSFQYVVVDKTTNIPCMLLNMTIRLKVSYHKIDQTFGKANLVVPKNAITDGTCSEDFSQVILMWNSTKSQKRDLSSARYNTILFNFVNDGLKSTLDSIVYIIHFDRKTFPDAAKRIWSGKTSAGLKLLSTTVNQGYYICKEGINVEAVNVRFKIKNVSLIAFNKDSDSFSKKEENCLTASNANDGAQPMAAIIGGVITGTLIVAGVIFYLCRRRSSSYDNTIIPTAL